MMNHWKSVFTGLFSILFISLCAQNYENICFPGITSFKDINGNLKAFRRDSVKILPGSDTVFISYNAYRDTSGVCKDTSNGDILGRKVLKKTNGIFYFFNIHKDTVVINTQAGVNQSWKFCPLPSGAYIEARVNAVSVEPVLGFNDQVKQIILQAKNGAGSGIAHPLNGKIIRLSMHYGLSAMLDIYRIPDDTVIYHLAGLTGINAGISDLQWRDVYNYNTGDEFHHFISWWCSLGAWYDIRTIERVLDKTVFGNNDSVTYLMERCSRRISSYPPHYSNYYDTISVSYNFDYLTINDPLKLPDEYTAAIEPSSFYGKIFSVSGRLSKGKIISGLYDPGTHCYGIPLESGLTEMRYTEGLGQTLNHYEYWSDGLFVFTDTLAFYKKGSEVWGTPVATNCAVLTGQPNPDVPESFFIRIFPNPVESEAVVTLPGVTGSIEYQIYNSNGVKVKEGTGQTNPMQLSFRQLPAGLYIMIFRETPGTRISKARIVKQ